MEFLYASRNSIVAVYSQIKEYNKEAERFGRVRDFPAGRHAKMGLELLKKLSRKAFRAV